ncbi:hypothetical protein BH235_004625 [Salmonella enterica subsp. enterica serovar Javiana]|nr:hypothetical protein [Salmonella enterica subsp. enterica serovar Javiana]
MGLFGGVSQGEYDALKTDFQRVVFINDLNAFKAASALMFSDMKLQVGKSCGVIDTVSALIDAQLIETAKNLYTMVEGQLVESINKANQYHRDIVAACESLGTAQTAYINHLQQDKLPLYQQVSELMDLNQHCINMLKSMDQMFGIVRD